MVGGEALNLNNLEKNILIPDFREPRIHFAIVCASQSCPKLRSWAYTAEQLEEQLNDSARRFINDPTRNRFDQEQKVAYLSKIFDWFTEDFVARSGSLTNYVSQVLKNLRKVATNERLTTLHKNNAKPFFIQMAKHLSNFVTRHFITTLIQRQVTVATGRIASEAHFKNGQDGAASQYVGQRSCDLTDRVHEWSRDR